METDAVVGRVLDAIEKMGHYPSGPVRGYKTSAWEGGHRIPFMVRWPAMVKPGSVCPQLVQQADLMATFADVLGSKLPEHAGVDSFSRLPLLKGGDQPVRQNAVNCSAGGIPAVREGSWKLILAQCFGGKGKNDHAQNVHVYYLAEDLVETKNLAAEQPERVAQMQALLEKLVTDGRSTPGAIQANDVEVKRF